LADWRTTRPGPDRWLPDHPPSCSSTTSVSSVASWGLPGIWLKRSISVGAR
jgi:hypothetical protein